MSPTPSKPLLAVAWCQDGNDVLQPPSGTFSAGPYPATSDGSMLLAYSLQCFDIYGDTSNVAQLTATVIAPVVNVSVTLSCVAYSDPTTNNLESLCTFASTVPSDTCALTETSQGNTYWSGGASATNVIGPLQASGGTFGVSCASGASASSSVP